jgi:hypothetical protein
MEAADSLFGTISKGTDINYFEFLTGIAVLLFFTTVRDKVLKIPNNKKKPTGYTQK